jgi:UDP-N-acetylmuramate dehydrogenase
LQPDCPKEYWLVERLAFEYRTSALKRLPGKTVIAAAQLRLSFSTPEAVQSLLNAYTAKRHISQPPGASMGSTFKNPTNDFAGRLIEAAGLKGTNIGGVEISTLHANFIINVGGATATSYMKMIKHVHDTVKEKFGVELQPEIEFLGSWEEMSNLNG